MSGQGDTRLFSVRNLAESQKGAKASANIYEFEVIVDAPVRGEFAIGPFAMTAWDPDDGPEGTPRSMVLTIDSYLVDVVAPGSAAKAVGRGFYHSLTLPEEVCALATTLLRKRISLGPLLRANGIPLRIKPQPPRRHDAIVRTELDLDKLEPAMQRVFKLPLEFHQVFILACRMYQEALMLIDSKPDLAYLLLVSCVEVFVGKLGRKTLETDLKDAVKEALARCDEGGRQVLLQEILDLDRGISRNFVAFIIENLDEQFWLQPGRPAPPKRVEPEELPEILKRIYAARSKLVHEAEPFPPNVLDAPDDESEIDRRPELVIGEKRWSGGQMIPYARFFERLIQHVLVRFLERHSVANG